MGLWGRVKTKRVHLQTLTIFSISATSNWLRSWFLRTVTSLSSTTHSPRRFRGFLPAMVYEWDVNGGGSTRRDIFVSQKVNAWCVICHNEWCATQWIYTPFFFAPPPWPASTLLNTFSDLSLRSVKNNKNNSDLKINHLTCIWLLNPRVCVHDIQRREVTVRMQQIIHINTCMQKSRVSEYEDSESLCNSTHCAWMRHGTRVGEACHSGESWPWRSHVCMRKWHMSEWETWQVYKSYGTCLN